MINNKILTDYAVKLCAKYNIKIIECDKETFASSHLDLSVGKHIGFKIENNSYTIYISKDFDTYNSNVDIAIRNLLVKIIIDYKCNKMENKCLSQKAIDYCNKWGVEVINVTDEIYHLFKNNFNTGRSPFAEHFCIDWNNKIIYAKCHTDADLEKHFDKHGYYIDNFYWKNKIPESEWIYVNKDKTLIHELTHIMMKIRPELIDEFTSPFFQAWILNLNMIEFVISENKKRDLMSSIYNTRKDIYGENDFDKLINSRTSELVAAGIFYNDKTPTYDLENIVPDVSWVNIKACM